MKIVIHNTFIYEYHDDINIWFSTGKVENGKQIFMSTVVTTPSYINRLFQMLEKK